MKPLITFLLLNIFLSTVFAQEKVSEISFGSAGMIGFYESIIIRQDSTFVFKKSGDININIKFLTSKETWERLINSISQYSLKDLENPPSPSHAREYDGALFSVIAISTNLKKYDCGQFDDYNPNEKLKPLMGIMLESKNVKL